MMGDILEDGLREAVSGHLCHRKLVLAASSFVLATIVVLLAIVPGDAGKRSHLGVRRLGVPRLQEVKAAGHNAAYRLPDDQRCEKWVVITTINYPTEAVKVLAALHPAWRTVVVGDTKTPADWAWQNVTFLSIAEQEKTGYRIATHIPFRHYGRKNFGYMYAIANGAKVIYETDDDNMLLYPDLSRAFVVDGGRQWVEEAHTRALTLNPYPIFGQETVWPRGYPLQLIGTSNDFTLQAKQIRPVVQQGLANGDPDVDAIFRLTRKHVNVPIDITFTDRPPVALPPHVYTPFNSQNTLFQYEALWGLLIPVTTTFRVCDIWRGYFTQRLLADIGGRLVFNKPSVVQRRNEHDYLLDFKDEEPLYEDALRLIEFLDAWQPQSPDVGLPERFVELSSAMAKEGFWGVEDAALSQAWIEDLLEAGYVFPPLASADDSPEATSPPAPLSASEWLRLEDHIANSSIPPHVKEALSLSDLPVLKPGRIPYMQLTSHEGNTDLSNFLYQLTDDDGLVLVDMEGPGCIHRAFLIMETAPPEITLRLDDHVVLKGDVKDVFTTGADGRLPRPFLTFLNQASGMTGLFPFCFNRSAVFSVSYGDHPDWLQQSSDCVRDDKKCLAAAYVNIVGERRAELPHGFDAHTYTEPVLPPTNETWSEYLSYNATLQRVKATPGMQASQVRVEVGGGQGEDVFDFTGSGAIRAIVLTTSTAAWDALEWKMTWDGAEQPHVCAPFDRFYGSWREGDSPFLGYHMGAWESDGTVTAYVFHPMPFSAHSVGSIINRQHSPVSVSILVLYEMDGVGVRQYVPGTVGYYHVQWTYKDWEPCFNTLLSVQGQAGHVVGHSFRLHGCKVHYVENDPVVYVDDGRTPKIWYSGQEDDFGGAHGFEHYRSHDGPFFGWHYEMLEDDRHGGGPNNTIHAYRNAFGDSHRFMRNYVYGIQGHNRQERPAMLDYTFHYYASPQPLLHLSDELDMGDDDSLVSHQYHAEPPVPFTSLQSAVNGRWYHYVSRWHYFTSTPTTYDCSDAKEEWVTRRGVVMQNGTIEFTARIREENSGVILRRLIDLFYTPQRAVVHVDGVSVGVWADTDHAPEFAPLRFADNTDFIVPARYTAGKSQIRVRLQVANRHGAAITSPRRDYNHLKGFAWSAFHYWVYSITA